jgi:Transglycosylase SLT domain
MIEAAATARGLPVEFFAQVIWQESRFKSDAVGPVTRSGQRALGIAQFMPLTAAERRLDNPFDPVQALPKSAEFLHDLWNQFGNPGLAAAAYNAGPQRVRDWLARKRPLPMETQNYVRKVTGRAVEEWAGPVQKPLFVTFPQGLSCVVTANSGAAKPLPIVGAGKPLPTVVAVKPPPMAIGAKPLPTAIAVNMPPASSWYVQLFGDRSEFKAMTMYFQLQKKHQDILGSFAPDVVRTTPRPGAPPIWSRVRVATANRQFADTLCFRLRAAGESCLVQHN